MNEDVPSQQKKFITCVYDQNGIISFDSDISNFK